MSPTSEIFSLLIALIGKRNTIHPIMDFHPIALKDILIYELNFTDVTEVFVIIVSSVIFCHYRNKNCHHVHSTNTHETAVKTAVTEAKADPTAANTIVT